MTLKTLKGTENLCLQLFEQSIAMKKTTVAFFHSVAIFLHRYPAILVGVVANLLVVGMCCQLAFEAPPGAAIRPMGLVAGLFLIPFAATPLGVVLSILAIKNRKNVGISLLGMLLSLAPFPLGWFAFHSVVDLMNYTLKP